MTVLFPYAAIFVAGAFVTMLFVRHGDSVPLPPRVWKHSTWTIDQEF